MPGFDGTGSLGQGPMTGRGMGFCVLQESKDGLGRADGLAGLQGMPTGNVNTTLIDEKEVINMPHGNGAGPAGLGPMTGKAAGFLGYPVPGYMNPVVAGRYATAIGPSVTYGYNQGAYGYGIPYTASRSWVGRGFPGLGFGRGFGRGRGFRGGRGRFGRW